MSVPRSVPAQLNAKLRNARWCEAHRSCRRMQPWLSGAPPYSAHLPGGATAISMSPVPQWPIELRNTRALHGAITSILDEPHERWPKWALIPWQRSWAVYWLTPSGAALALSEREGVLFDRPTRFRFGPLVRFRTPTVEKRGRHRVRIDTVTPIVWTDNGRTTPVTCPTATNVANSLSTEFARRLAPSDLWYEWVRARVRVNLLERATQPAHVPIGGKYGTVSGWQGSLVLEVNATARWLLLVAERMGLGSRTAFGFGRVRVSEEPC